MVSTASFIDNSLVDLPLDRRSCQLLGPTALVVQALMGVLAILSLVYKRHRETQKRPWKIWLFDVSKQVAGQMFVHGLNVLISDLGSHHSAGNACTYYFLNILVDTTLGVGLIYLVLQSLTWLLSKNLGIKGLKMGQYGNPPSIAYWLRQAVVYVCAITTMKFLVVALFAVWPGIYGIGDWLLSWTIIGDGDSFQVIFVMGIFPVMMNVLQFWLIDSIVKASGPTTAHSTSPRNSNSQDREPLFNSPDDDDDVVPQDIESVSRPSASRTMSEGDYKTLLGEGDNKSRVTGSGSSSLSTLPRSSVVAAHDYPPSSVGSASSLVSNKSSRSRHKYKLSAPPPLDLPIPYALAINSVESSRNTAQNVAAQPTDDTVRAEDFDALEKSDWVGSERVGGCNTLRSEQPTRTRVSNVR